jgi:hypothetical protein
MLPEAATSLIAGSVAGALGVGAAFPLDTIKTYQQVRMEDRSRIEYFVSPSGEVSIIRSRENERLFRTVCEIYQTHGLAGFYGGYRRVCWDKLSSRPLPVDGGIPDSVWAVEEICRRR